MINKELEKHVDYTIAKYKKFKEEYDKNKKNNTDKEEKLPENKIIKKQRKINRSLVFF